MLVHLAIFAKYWEPGKVKTRLAKKLGEQLACDVYVTFLQYLLEQFSGFGDQRTVVYTPLESEALFREAVPQAWGMQSQADGDLGVRMQTFFESCCGNANRKNILIGSDTPDLPLEAMQQAADALNDVPVVIGPSADGGYYLIGIRGEVPDIFAGVPWSTEQVLQLTLAKLQQQEVPCRLLPELKDVDELEDLQRLLDILNNGGQHDELLAGLQRLELPIA